MHIKITIAYLDITNYSLKTEGQCVEMYVNNTFR